MGQGGGMFRAVVVAQLVEWSLPTPEFLGSNPDIDKILSTNCTIEKPKIKNERPGTALLFLRRWHGGQQARLRSKLPGFEYFFRFKDIFFIKQKVLSWLDLQEICVKELFILHDAVVSCSYFFKSRSDNLPIMKIRFSIIKPLDKKLLDGLSLVKNGFFSFF